MEITTITNFIGVADVLSAAISKASNWSLGSGISGGRGVHPAHRAN